MADDATWEKFKAVVVEILQVVPEKVIPSAQFGEDLEADSLDFVELVMALEEAFDIKIEEAELADIKTVEQALNLVKTKLPGTI